MDTQSATPNAQQQVMTSAEYRERAERLLTAHPSDNLPARNVEQAAVWVQLAHVAAHIEATQDSEQR